MATQFEIDRLPAGLADAIEKQLPNTSHQEKSSRGSFKRSEEYSVWLSDANREPLIAFGLGPNDDAYDRVRKAAIELKRAIIALDADGLREINWASPGLYLREGKPIGHETHYLAGLLEEAASNLIGKRKAGVKASKKRDWRAAALAKTARKIWAEEEWLSNPDRYGPIAHNALAEFSLPEHEREKAKKHRSAYEQHLRDFAPHSEKHDAPGPFGRFLTIILEIFGRDISAASALRSMRDAEKIINRG